MTKKLTLLLAVLAISMAANAKRMVYPHDFAPSEGLVNRMEKTYRSELCLNGYWDFQPVALPADFQHGSGVAPELPQPTADGWDATRIKIPSPWNINDFAFRNLEGPDHRNYPSYPKAWELVKMAWMRKMVDVPSDWDGRQIRLHFEAVAGMTVVYVNGQRVGENFDLFLPFSFDVTPYVKAGQRAEILVGVRSQWLFEDNSTVGRRVVPAGSMWGYHINGIWQDVYLIALPTVNIQNVFVKPLVNEHKLQVDATVENTTDKKIKLQFDAQVREWINRAGTDVNSAPVPAWDLGGEALKSTPQTITIDAHTTKMVSLDLPVADGTLRYWTPETPNLYALLLSAKTGKQTVDLKYERFGWRQWTFDGTVLQLNRQPYQLKGDSWHFQGIPQMTRRYAWAWFTAIKGMNGNAVRLHAQVYPRLYMEMADEMGICILDETANWASDGGPKLDSETFFEHSRDHLRRFVERDRNYASVFGWSISNENKPVILYVFKRPDLLPRQKEEWGVWRDIVRETDPTRPWISSDGEDDGDGMLPVTVGHYGDMNAMQKWQQIGKPWGIGETGMCYYGTPEQVARKNGQRAYESAEGRMEGLANECYHLIKDMRAMGASYTTVFNMVWYALKPLPLGKHDLTTAPTIDDGIFFQSYVEGKPGVQPERIGPYCTTLNPGYDASLPLFQPWPLYDALRAANAGPESAWSSYVEVDTIVYRHEYIAHADNHYSDVVFIGDRDGKLATTLSGLGVKLTRKATKPQQTLYIVHAATLPIDAPLADISSLVERGAALWIWGITPETAQALKPLLPCSVDFDSLSRSSFLPENRSWMSGLQNSDFYFCEVQKNDAARYTLKGQLVSEGDVLLRACRTDWRRWNLRPEEIKTAGLLRSENETTASLPVFVKCGRVYVSTLDDFADTSKGARTLSLILHAAGVDLGSGAHQVKADHGIDRDPNNLFLDPSVDTSKKTTN